MSIDILQEKIRKLKNPSVVELMLPLTDLPPRYAHDAKGYGEFCRDLLGGLKGIVPAVRLSFGVFALLGGDGLQELAQTLNTARNMGYYAVLDAPELLSPTAAQITAEAFFGGETDYPCDGLVVSGYLGSDIIKPFLPGCREGKKDLFVAARTGNKSAPGIAGLALRFPAGAYGGCGLDKPVRAGGGGKAGLFPNRRSDGGKLCRKSAQSSRQVSTGVFPGGRLRFPQRQCQKLLLRL